MAQSVLFPRAVAASLPLPTPLLLTASTSTTAGLSVTTASITPSRPTFAFIVGVSSSVPNPPTASGCGLTWTVERSIALATERRLTLFKTTGTPTAGAVTFTFTQSQSGFLYSVFEVEGADTANPVVQSVAVYPGTSGNTGTSTLAALGSSSNLHVCATTHRTAQGITPDADFTELSDTPAYFTSLEVQWARGETVCNPTWATTEFWATASIEIKAA